MKDQNKKEAFWISEFSEIYGPSRTTVYEQINKGRLKAFKIGRRTAISREDAQAWLRLCQSESEKSA